MKNILLFIFSLTICNLYCQNNKSTENVNSENEGVCLSGNCSMGLGIMKWKDNTTYIGEFWNEIPSGQGTVIWSDGSIYVGTFNNGMYTGQGTLINSQSIYIGEFNQDLRNGFGTILIESGTYIGDFSNGKLEGKGVFINRQGKIEEAIFKNNQATGDTLIIRENYIRRGTN